MCVCVIIQALEGSTEVELTEQKIRRRVEPERWPIPGLSAVATPPTDLSQLVHCPEFVPRQGSSACPGETGSDSSKRETKCDDKTFGALRSGMWL